MNRLNKLLAILLLAGFSASSYAAIENIELVSCGILFNENGSDSEKKEDDKKQGGKEEEEPDCE